MQSVNFHELYSEFKRILEKDGFSEDRANLCAKIFAENTRDGVHSHGINRFPGFIDYVRRGLIDVQAEPVIEGGFGAFERWDGRRGAGVLNAYAAMDRAVQVARQHGMGCVALRNTNHWMRAGTYGLQAADAGCIGMCWTNTKVIMPPWGSMEPKLGNNPLVVCMPRKGDHLLLDMAMSQFSLGRLLIADKAGERLSVPGGFDEQGHLTDDAGKILSSKSPLPIGYLKGSGLALMLDCMVSVLSGGQATFQIGTGAGETGVSQVFIAIDLVSTGCAQTSGPIVEQILEDLRSAKPMEPGGHVSFPGEHTSQRRRTSNQIGISVDSEMWRSVKLL
ncbi:MAG: 3-dehydro-L-gulonate 2-dehydrogenase [Acidobacteria bacterium]|nr:3-dehydro-L-gulonate 2-dehydrogenase [Acidobacteriota bacterium]